ncbi:MAG TPA: MlaD family protein [Planctomycetota bacterium]|nr:MlaD family protein [Planctomycetota bacterium]
MKTSRLTDTLLGLVFFGTLIGLGIATIVLSDVKFGVPHYDVDLVSPDVGYLRPGDPVLVYGMPSGKVEAIERLPEAMTVRTPEGGQAECRVLVRARMDLDLYARMPRDSRIVVEDRGLLGGKLVRIEKGASEEFWPRDEPMLVLERQSVLESAGDVIAENREGVRHAIENLAQVTESARSGHGVLGMLLTDDQLADDVRKIVKHALGAIEDARESTPVQSVGSFLFGTF